jgi:formylglycine-generating enzyme required for sulfatase activity
LKSDKIHYLFLLVFVFSAFAKSKPVKFKPPGTVQITETFFVDITEVSNFSWLEYMFWTARKYGSYSTEFLNTKPDTLVWENNLYLQKNYLRRPEYRDHPVVGISYEQVLNFCKWRTDRVKEYYALRYKKNLAITYTLPTKEEWENFAMSSSNSLSNKGRDAKGRLKLNFKHKSESDSINDKALTEKVYTYEQNWFGLYNCLGNVAEMTDEKGNSKGGSWIHDLENCRVGKDIFYSSPQSWLGFRCVCTFTPGSLTN